MKGTIFVDEAGNFVENENQYFSAVFLSKKALENLRRLEFLGKINRKINENRNKILNFLECEKGVRAILTSVHSKLEIEISRYYKLGDIDFDFGVAKWSHFIWAWGVIETENSLKGEMKGELEELPSVESLLYDRKTLPKDFKEEFLQTVQDWLSGCKNVFESSVQNPGIQLADFLVSGYRDMRENQTSSYIARFIHTKKVYQKDLSNILIWLINKHKGEWFRDKIVNQ